MCPRVHPLLRWRQAWLPDDDHGGGPRVFHRSVWTDVVLQPHLYRELFRGRSPHHLPADETGPWDPNQKYGHLVHLAAELCYDEHCGSKQP